VPRDLGDDLTEEVELRPPAPLDGFAMLQVWLETGYDGGRIAAWVPDVPGSLAVADTRERALTLAIGTTARVREWLEAHADEAWIPRIWRSEAAGEVATVREPDGYEVNATFPADRRRVTEDEVAAAIRRLEWAHEDIRALGERIERFEAANEPLPTDASRGERTPAAVIRHVAGSSVWLVGRLPGGGRYDGALEAVLPGRVLDETQAWVTDRLRALDRTDDGTDTPDRHGETWTLAKVLRRLQGHVFDHTWELERRLVRADGTRERVRVVLDRTPETGEVVGLLRSVGWDLRASEPASLERAIAGTNEFATAWDGDRLIGTARSITDGAQSALIATVVVHPAYQGVGVGERMLHLLTDGRDLVRFSLAAAPGLEPWYRKLGFVPDPHAMFRPRRRG
jgi:N-acetylglutamate synthase-like GNAT family acetyltransferase